MVDVEPKKSSKFFRLYTSAQGRIYSSILMMVHNPSVADDLLQETAAIMWEKFDHFEEGTNFAAWGIRIAKNKCLEYLRQNKRTKQLFCSMFYEEISSCVENVTEDFSRRCDALESCCEKLTSKQRKLLKLRFTDGISMKDISARYGRPVSTLYQHVYQILELLRICILKNIAEQEA